MSNPTKQCTKCKLEKSFIDFSKNRATKDGLNNWCKPCLHRPSIKNLGRDLSGIRFGKLVVINKSRSTGETTIWNCQCDCGNTIEIRRGNLISTATNSCGCIKVGQKGFAVDVRLENVVWNMFIQRCKFKKFIFELTKEEMMKLVIQPCFYCGLESSNKVKRKYGEFQYNGLDRIDNSVGYAKNNILVSCRHCNALKMDVLSVEETVKVIELLKTIRGIDHSPWQDFKRTKRREYV